MVLLLIAACTRVAPPTPYPSFETELGPDYALNIFPDGKISWQNSELSVDAADGWRWFDVAWVPNEDPNAFAHRWGAKHCAPVMWDTPTTPIPGTVQMGGFCTREYKRYWAFLTMETYGEHMLATGYIADQNAEPYEVAWMDFVGSALSLTQGATPLAHDLRFVQEAVRASSREEPGFKPVPGGGLFSTKVAPKLTPIYEARRAAPPPRPLRPVDKP